MIYKSHFPPVTANLDTNFHHHVFNRPEQKNWEDYTAYIDYETGTRRSYYEFLDRVHDATTGLGSCIERGGLDLNGEGSEMVGILSENCLDWPVLVHALLALTTPFAMLSFYSTRFELTHAMRLCKVTRLFVHPNVLDLATSVAQELGIPADRIYMLGGSVRGKRSLDDFVQLARTRKLPRIGVRPATRDTLAYLVFSSGTSGFPKGVMISHGNLTFSLYQFAMHVEEAGKVSAPEPLKTLGGLPTSLGFLPMYHSYGLHLITMRTFLAPTTQIILAKWNVKACLECISKYRVSHLSLIPSVVHQIVNYPNVEQYDFSAVVFAGCGAAHLPAELADRMQKLLPVGLKVTEGYGMSEITMTAMSEPAPGMFSGKIDPAPGSAGILWPGMEARIVREDGSDADVNEVGELHVRGANRSLGYWDNENASKDTFAGDGWVRSGDLFRADEMGRFFFVERAKDTLKISGIQVSPVEIETVLLAEPSKLIADVSVAGVQGHGRTSDETVPRAWVVLNSKGKELERTQPGKVARVLEEWSQANLSKFKWLRGGIEVIDEIPKSPTGKVLRRLLRDSYDKSIRAEAKL